AFHDTPVKRPSGISEKRVERSTCSSRKMLTAKKPGEPKCSRIVQSWAMDTITTGGSSEIELKELIVRPCGAPSGARVVRIATPVANRPQACRKRSALDKGITLILSWGLRRRH